MHVIVVGCGRVGSGLAARLSAGGHSVAILDKNIRAFRRLPPAWPGTTVVGSGFDRDALDQAGADRAGALAAVTSGDNSNILTARIARETYQIHNVVARIYDPRRAQIYLRLGIPTVATVAWTIDQVERRLIPGASDVDWSDTTGTMLLVERDVPDHLAGHFLTDLDVPGEIRLVSVTRSGVARLDVDQLVGQEGDVLHFAVASHARDRLDAALAGDAPAGARAGGTR
ncbi:MAG: TrkA family potassium uptake protein [Actinomycetota bacterium]|nr:TrkA family potassium uptake protein [Actinomycetota bacterium]